MYCKKCGKENKNDATFCVACGEKLSYDMSAYDSINQKEKTDVINKDNTKSKNKKILFIIIGVIVGVVILIASINGIKNAILAKQVSDDFSELGDLAEENFGDIHFDYEVPEYGITYAHDTSLDVEPPSGITGGSVSTETIGDYMSTDEWIATFSYYSYQNGIFNICDENSAKTVVSDFGLTLDENSQSFYDNSQHYSDSINLTLVDDKTYADTAFDKLEISAKYQRNTNDLTDGKKKGSDFIVTEISARDYYVDGPDNDFTIADLRIGQSVSGKTFDEFGTATGIIVKNGDKDDVYYEYAQDAFDNSLDGETIIVYYLSEPEEIDKWGMNNFYMTSFQISAKTKKITSMKLAYVESCGFGMLML